MPKTQTEQLKAELLRKQTPRPVPTEDLLSSGSTVLNLACSGRHAGAFAKGTYCFFVGDSSSGKTIFTMTTLAEAAKNKQFKDHRLILDDVEHGMKFDVESFFGSLLTKRLEPPFGTKAKPRHSRLLEESYDRLEDLLTAGEPVVYIQDSNDALLAGDDVKTRAKQRKAKESGEDAKGSYGTAKAKLNSSRLPHIVSRLARTGSILIIVSQTRANIGFGAQFNPKTRSGGNALTFYATLELWTSVTEHLKKRVRGKDREIGIRTRIKVKKNRIQGGVQVVDVPIYRSLGLDDVGGCVDYLVSEKHWKTTSKEDGAGKIIASDFDGVEMDRESLCQYIEANELERELKATVAQVWRSIDGECAVQRKRRYE